MQKGLSWVLSLICAWMLTASSASALGGGPEVWIGIDPSQGEFPESITVDRDGRLYVSVASEVRTVDDAGQLQPFASLPIPAFVLGVKVGPDDCVYAASTSLDPSVAGAFVWRACEAGEMEIFATLDPTGGPNDLAFLPDGRLLVTDPILGRIYEVSAAGDAAIWLEGPSLQGTPADPALLFAPQGANGIAVGRHGRNVYVGNLDQGRILRVRVRHDGSAGPVVVHADDDRLRGADGIALDQLGNLYVAVNAQDSLVLVTPLGWVWPLAQGAPLDGPSSLVFGTSGPDRHTLFLVNGAFMRAFGLKAGTPQPSIAKQRVWIPGLSLH